MHAGGEESLAIFCNALHCSTREWSNTFGKPLTRIRKHTKMSTFLWQWDCTTLS